MDTHTSLLVRLRQPSLDQAWPRFVELYTPLLYQWARRGCCQEADAADLVQEALLHLIRKLPEFVYDRHKSFSSWLCLVVHNCWRNLRRRNELPRQANGQDLAELGEADAADPFWEAEYRQGLLKRALELMQTEFQPTTWKACWQCVVDGQSAAEVAQALGISPGAVYMAKSRVLSRLRQELDGLMD
jgi:RNA polymerase sigma-70 factor, ECF subfamily